MDLVDVTIPQSVIISHRMSNQSRKKLYKFHILFSFPQIFYYQKSFPRIIDRTNSNTMPYQGITGFTNDIYGFYMVPYTVFIRISLSRLC